ncbi:hypothetical protein GCM10023213_35980 [Prosthecobacter algae]|uniref:Uncharacterized protein n=1 Tax=Prosthecobacter algae TaxID=1144682 RepID=A0ABP9PDR3_9BACT
MKTSSLLLALVPALFLTSCYVTPAGGPYRAPGPRPGPGYGGDYRPGYDRGRDGRDDHRGHDHDRDGRGDRDDRDGDRGRYDRDRDPRTGRPTMGYRDPRGPGGPGAVVVLPRGARRVVHGGSTYYTSGTSWYRASGSGYIGVARPY